MQLSSVSTIQKPNRHRHRHRNVGSVVQETISGACGNTLQADALQRHLLAMVERPECQVIDDYVGTQNRINDKTKRSDTAKRHVLSRQKPIQKDEHQTPNTLRYN